MKNWIVPFTGVAGLTLVFIAGCDSDSDPVESCDRPHADCAALCAEESFGQVCAP